MKKNIFKTVSKSLAIIMAVSMLSLTSCGGGDDPTENPNPNPEQPNQPNNPSDVAVTSVALDKTTLELKVDAKGSLTATVSPTDATNKTVTWSSDKENVAKVSSNGEVTAVAEGTATITAKAGDKTATCAVTVTEVIQPEPEPEPEPTPASELKVELEGEINHNTYTKGQTASVIFNRFPASIDEFKKVQEQIGGEPHGAVALELMAAEMYRRDKTVGAKCIELCNVSSNIYSQMDQWKQLFDLNDKHYARPYQVAAFLQGANPDNEYTPKEPYTIKVNVGSTAYSQEKMFYNSTVITLEVLTEGKGGGKERVEVIKPGKCIDFPQGSKYFLVQNCPGLYAQVIQIFDLEWNKLK